MNLWNDFAPSSQDSENVKLVLYKNVHLKVEADGHDHELHLKA